MKCLYLLVILLFFSPVLAETDGYNLDEDTEYSDGDIDIVDEEEELPDFEYDQNEDGAGLSMVTAVHENTVVYGRVFYNYISDYSLGRVYIYERIGDTDEFELTAQIPSDREKTNFFGGYVALSENRLFVMNSVYSHTTLNEKKLFVYIKDDVEGWRYYKNIKLPENYEFTSTGFVEDNGNILVSVHNTILGEGVPELFVYSPDDDYVSLKNVTPENFDKDAYLFSFPRGFDISDNTIVATSTSLESEMIKGSTRVHIFEKNSESGEWEEIQTIKSEQTDYVKGYYNIAISGDHFVVHSYLDDAVSVSSVQIFEKKEGSWELVKELLPEDVENNFGYNVSIGDEFAVATDKGYSKSLPFGTTYVFHKDYDPENPEVKLENNWGLYEKFEVTDESVTPLMGAVAVIDGNTLSMGAAPSILKSNNDLNPYIEKLEIPQFSEVQDDEVSDNEIDDTTENTDEIELPDENEIVDNSGNDEAEIKDTSEVSDDNNEASSSESSGCSTIIL